ncbi:MAG: chemotaxis protein CheW [Rickettsiales bacterium]
MDEFVADFLAETRESLEILDNDVLALEKTPDDPEIVGNIFRVMHTIKGTCGFLGLERLAAVAHAGENVLDKIRNNELHVKPVIVSAILQSVDRIKELLDALEKEGGEPSGKDDDVIAGLNACLRPGAGVASVPLPPPPPAPKIEGPERQKHEEAGIDSDALQALFDATPSAFDFAAPPPPEEKTAKQDEKSVPKTASAAKPAAGDQAIRVSLETLEKLMQHASELVLTRNQLMQILRRQENSAFDAALQRLNHITTDLQEQVMKTRMQPIGNAWAKLPRIIRDLSIELRKKIELVMEGEEVELDRQLLECIRDPLTHMIRNSADHGIESPAARLAAGKPETGTVRLKAYQGGGYIIVEISDDGAGIPPDKIRLKIVEKGLATAQEAAEMSDDQAIQYIFMPGFSTAEKVTSVSGRGVGMDVVKTNIEKISGSVHLKSEVGKGSVFTIKIPLTLAIMPILEVGCAGQFFALPQIGVVEVVKSRAGADSIIEYIDDCPVLRLRENLIPLVFMQDALRIPVDPSHKREAKYIVVCAVGESQFGVVVDKVHDVEEIVVKPVASKLKNLDIYSGCTILGNGSVILILDVGGLARAVGAGVGEAGASNETKSDEKEAERAVSFVVFESGGGAPKIVPLELLSRLETIDVARVEYSQGHPVVQYRGDWMRLVFPEGESAQSLAEGEIELLVFNDRGNTIGVKVDRIVDVVKCPVSRRSESAGNGFVGSMVVGGKTCDVVDVSRYFDVAFPESKAAPPDVSAFKGKRVLLVDDSPFFRKVVAHDLRQLGLEVQVAENGQKALEYLERHAVDVVVTDLTMPVMSGQKMAEAIKTRPNHKHLPVVAFSSWNAEQRGVPEKALFECFVPKTRLSELHAALQRACRQTAQP